MHQSLGGRESGHYFYLIPSPCAFWVRFISSPGLFLRTRLLYPTALQFLKPSFTGRASTNKLLNVVCGTPHRITIITKQEFMKFVLKFASVSFYTDQLVTTTQGRRIRTNGSPTQLRYKWAQLQAYGRYITRGAVYSIFYIFTNVCLSSYLCQLQCRWTLRRLLRLHVRGWPWSELFHR